MGQIKNIKLHIVTDIKLYQHITQKNHSKMADEAIPAVPESISKRAKNLERVKAARAVAVVKRRKALKEKRGIVYKRAAKYAKDIALKSVMKSDSDVWRNAMATSMFLPKLN